MKDHECFYIYGRCHRCGADQPSSEASLSPAPASALLEVADRMAMLASQLRGYDKHLRRCMGWTMRAYELEVSSGMQEAQLDDLKEAESFLSNAKGD